MNFKSMKSSGFKKMEQPKIKDQANSVQKTKVYSVVLSLNHVLRKSKIRSYKYVKSYLRN